jgi:hypothetical protein
MIQVFLIQLFFAVVPSLCGLVLLAFISPKTFRLAKQSLQLDVLSGVLLIALLVGLWGINFALVDGEVAGKSFQELLREMWNPTSQDAASRLYTIFFLSLMAAPALIFGRLIMDMLFEKPLDIEDRR